jgi:hypothetical protein
MMHFLICVVLALIAIRLFVSLPEATAKVLIKLVVGVVVAILIVLGVALIFENIEQSHCHRVPVPTSVEPTGFQWQRR